MTAKASLSVLVAGGAGMIGSHLCERLLRAGHRVICADNLSTGRMVNLETIRRHENFEFIEQDVVYALPRFTEIDRVYHLASPASPPGYARLPVETMRVNSEGTRHLAEVAADHGARFLFCSTSEAYGDPLVHPQVEDYRGNVSSTGPRSTYDEAKRFGEALTMAYVRSFGLDGRVVRIFNTYGPRSDPQDGRLVVNLITQALRGEAMTIYGNGLQTRSLCYVSDMVEGLIAVMESPRTRGEVLNVGNPEEHTVLDFARIIASLTGTDSPMIFTDPAVGDDPQRRRPNIDKIRDITGWEPYVSLHDGLRATIEDLRASLKVAAVANRASGALAGVRRK